MKKLLLLSLVSALLFCLVACTTGNDVLSQDEESVTTHTSAQTTTITANTRAVTTTNAGVYTVTFDLGYDGKTFIAKSKNYKVEKPQDPTRDGYVFKGWYPVNENTPWVFAGCLVTEDMTLVAKWSLVRTTKTKATTKKIEVTSKTRTTVKHDSLDG